VKYKDAKLRYKNLRRTNVLYVVGLDNILNTRSTIYALHFFKANKSEYCRVVFQLLLKVDGGGSLWALSAKGGHNFKITVVLEVITKRFHKQAIYPFLLVDLIFGDKTTQLFLFLENKLGEHAARFGFRPGAIYELSLMLVLALLQGFFSGCSGFLPT